MTRSKFSTKVVLLATAIGLSTAAFAGSQPAAAQSYSDEYTCPAGTVYDPTYGCTNAGADDFGYDYGYPYGYGYSYPTILRGHPDHRFGHMGVGAEGTIVHHGMGFHHSIVGVGHFGGDGFGHGMGMGIAGGHNIGGGFGHGMAGGFGHGGGGGHR
jgi:hypothetical protein